MKTLKELKNSIVETPENIHSKKILACKDIYCQLDLPDGSIRVLNNGYIVYKNISRFTTFKLSECMNFIYTIDGEGTNLTYKDVEDLDWAVWAALYGEQRIENNMTNEYTRVICGEGRITSEKQKEYIEEKPDETLVDLSPTPEEIIVARDSFEELICNLPQRYQEFARKKYLYELSIQEIMKLDDCSYQTVASLNHHVLNYLRKQKMSDQT